MDRYIIRDGEIETTIQPGDRLVRKKSSDFFMENEEWNPESNFIKVFPEALNDIASQLTGTEMLVVVHMMPYISYQTGMLTKTGNNDDRYPIIQSDIEDITGLSKKATIVNMESLVSKRVYSRNRIGKSYQYFANPYIFFKGKYINKTLKAMFKNYKKQRNEE